MWAIRRPRESFPPWSLSIYSSLPWNNVKKLFMDLPLGLKVIDQTQGQPMEGGLQLWGVDTP